MTLGTLDPGNYGTIVHLGHAGFLVSIVAAAAAAAAAAGQAWQASQGQLAGSACHGLAGARHAHSPLE